jgi:hypothetical protein
MTTEASIEAPTNQDASALAEEMAAMQLELRRRDQEILNLKVRLAERSKKEKKGGNPKMRTGSLVGTPTRKGSMGKRQASDLRGSHDSRSKSNSPKREGFLKKKSLSSLITKPAGKAVRSSVAVLDKTVDIGWKAGKAVVKGSVVVFDKTMDTGKKAGRIFGFKSERQKRLSRVTEKNTITQWDNAVEIIEDLLDDNIAGLTAEQRSGLRAAQELLLGGVEQEMEKTYHIPINLLESSSSNWKSKRGGRVSMASKSYVLYEYGGITQRKARPALTRQEGIRPSVALKNFLSEDEWDEMIPSEFLALPQEKQCLVYKLLTWEKLKSWDYDIFDLDKATQGHPLVLMSWAVLGAPHSQRAMAKACGMLDSSADTDFLEGYNFVEAEMKLPLEKLSHYLRLIEDNYRDGNPYHNAIHAADVVQSLNALIQMAGDELKSTDEELFSILLAAVVHDVDHPGLVSCTWTYFKETLECILMHFALS